MHLLKASLLEALDGRDASTMEPPKDPVDGLTTAEPEADQEQGEEETPAVDDEVFDVHWFLFGKWFHRRYAKLGVNDMHCGKVPSKLHVELDEDDRC